MYYNEKAHPRYRDGLLHLYKLAIYNLLIEVVLAEVK